MSTSFFDQSTINQNQIVGWDWDFGDASPIDHNKNPTHVFATGNTYNVTLTVHSTEGCTNSVMIPVLVNPFPTVNTVPNQNVCNQDNTNPITFSSSLPGTTYTWTNSNTTIGLAASGIGDLPGFTALNTTTAPVVATISVIPNQNGCIGPPYNFTITVNPFPVLTNGPHAPVCSGAPFNVTLTSGTAGANFTWTAFCTPVGAVTGFTGTQVVKVTVINDILTNVTTDPATVTYHITPFANGCTGIPSDYTVTVYPSVVVTSAATANWCSGVSNTYTSTCSTTTPVPTYTWTRASVPGITPATGAGSGAAITEMLTNSTPDPLIVTYIITPTVGGCTGTPKNVAVTVDPLAIVSSQASVKWCNGMPNTYNITSTSTSPPPAYAWSRAAVAGISPATAAGTTDFITETLVNSTTEPVVVHYLITPSVNGCTGIPFDLSVTVDPTSVVTSPVTANWCNNVANTYNITSSTVSASLTLAWTRAAVAGISNPSNAGTGATITETLVNTTTDPVVVTYMITPTVDNCTGIPLAVNVTVNPTAVITSPATANYCNGVTMTYNITSNSTTPAPNYAWSRAAVAGILNPAGSGVGSAITETLVNTTTDPIVVTYLITPTVNNCDGTVKNVLVTVNPTAVITSAPSANWCNNTPNTYNITSSSIAPPPVFTWSRAAVTGISNLANSGTGNAITETLVNTTPDPVVVSYVITPTVNGCAGTPSTISVTVNPTSVVTSPATANWCNNTMTTYNILSSSSAPLPTFAWSRAVVAGISNVAGSGSGNSISESLNNTTPNPVIVTYLITPNVNGCNGTPFNLLVTVNPTAVITSAATANWCNGALGTYSITSASTTPPPTYAWTRAAVAGITPATGAGTGNSISETLTNATPDPITVSYVITPTVNGCDGTVKTIAVTVNPTVVITSAATANWCSNVVNTYNITSNSTTPPPGYTWTRAAVPGITPATGAGSGNSISETLVNATTDPIAVTYQVIPAVNGCPGTTKTVTVTVNPTAVVTSPALANWCNNTPSTYNITSSSTTPPPVFTWTRGAVAGITPAIGSGTGNSINETLTNGTPNPIVVNYAITPTVNGCAGTVYNVSVTVNPTAVVTSTATANWCNNLSNTYNITSSTTSTTPVYAWSRAAIPGITPATASGSSAAITETLVNSTTDPIVVNYVINLSVNGCPGTQQTVAVTVNPTAVITSPATASWCNNTSNTYNILSSSTTPPPTYAWSRAVVAGISNGANAGAGNFITETLNNTTPNPVAVTYVITPTVNSCAGTTKNVVVTVNPTALITSAATANWCNNVMTTYNILSSSTTPPPTYTWTRAAVTGISNAAGAGAGSSITEALVNTTTDPVAVTYVITPSVNGCIGTIQNVVVTVNPTAVITSPVTANWCNNVSNSYNITSSSSTPPPVFTWTRAAMPGITPATGAGTGITITETLLNATTNAIVVTYVVTPTVNGCAGTSQNVAVTVNPSAIITSPATANWANNVSNTYNITSSTTTPVPVYSWTRAAVAGITPATGAGVGPAITETLDNSTTNPIVVHYIITFTVNGCPGTTFDLAVTVNPTSAITSPPTANWCNNTTNTYNITSSTVPTPDYSWTRAAVPGISNPPGAGIGATITETLVNTTPDPVVATYVITPSINGFPGTPAFVAVTVNPTAVITSPATANWCNSILNSYSITSSSTLPPPAYTWTRTAVAGITPATGSGTGTPLTETLVNGTVNPVVVSYLITPSVNGCDGTPKTISVTVNPTAVITSPPTANWCNGIQGTYNITSSSNAPTPSYSWTRAAMPGITPATGAGASATIQETLTNATTDPIVVHYLVTPTVNSCTGTVYDVAVTVNPTAVITSVPTANWCNSVVNTYNVTSSSANPPPAYSWTRAAVAGITPATGAGAGAAISETLINSTTDPIVVSYVITPSVNGCTGTPKTINVTVNPTAVVTSPAIANWCNNTSTTYNITSSSTTPPPVFTWTRAAVAGITPATGAGSGNAITETLTNATTDPLVISYVVTPTVNGCAGTPKNISVTVNPTAVITSPATVAWCNNVMNTYNITSSSTAPPPGYNWTRAVVAGISNAAGAGAGNSIIETLVNTTTGPVTVTYVITPTVNGCTGTVKNVAVTVNPTPHLMNTAPLPICSAATFNATLLPDVTGGNFTWTASCSPAGSVTGFTTPQLTGTTTINDVLTNSVNIPATVTYAITPAANGCLGAVTNYAVIVYPVPNISCLAGQSICSATATAPVTLNSTVTGTVYSWSAACPVGSVNPCPVIPGIANPIPATSFTNVTNVQQTVTYTITSAYNGCPGTTTTHVVTVNPNATVTNWPLDQTICSGGSSIQVNLTSNVTGATYAWTASTISPITGFTTTGSDHIPIQNLFIPPGNTGFVNYHITPIFTSGPTCPGTSADYKINVNPLPTPVISGNTLVCELQPNVTYTTPSVPGHSYLWNVTGASSVTNATTNTVTVTWGPYTASPGTLSVTETIDATGCLQTTSTYSVTLQQRPIPSLTGPQTVCDQSSGNVYQTEAGMSTYTWSINGGSIMTGGGNGSPTATVTWNTPGTQWIQVNYVNSLGCPGYPAKQIPVLVNVLPTVTITEGTGPNCESATHSYDVPPDPLCSYAWSIVPAGRGFISLGQGTNSINVDWQTAGAATIAVTGTNNSTTCVASSTHLLTIHPKPLPTFTPCFDQITTSGAKKFILRGASPILAGQGVFSGGRVSFNALTGNYEFDPYGAGIGSYPITYTFTNNYGCVNSAGPVAISIVNSSFSCGGLLTDVRDGKTYKTSLVGGKCWMAQNLAYGTIIDGQTTPQTDNCINEKYCLPADATCSQYGGLYQWDELMRYASTTGNQGVCPPEWHVPTEAELQLLVNNISVAVISPADALAGSFMKDPLLNPGFFALLKGLYYINNTWSFTTGSLTATMYWSSTVNGTERALARGLNIFNPSMSRYDGSRMNAFSVRCVKDTP